MLIFGSWIPGIMHHMILMLRPLLLSSCRCLALCAQELLLLVEVLLNSLDSSYLYSSLLFRGLGLSFKHGPNMGTLFFVRYTWAHVLRKCACVCARAVVAPEISSASLYVF